MAFAHLPELLTDVGPLAQRFDAAGFRLYLVGGIVRDQVLDLPLGVSADIDLTTDARPAQIKQIVEPIAEALWTQGERFGTIGLRSEGRDYEITTHRAETYTTDSRKPAVVFGDDIDVDLSRRDFTVNAMAVDVASGELVDPFNGRTDLSDTILRTPLSPEISFEDDPLRILRAARFATRFGLRIDPALTNAASSLRDRIRIVSIERIGIEIGRLLALNGFEQGLRFLADTGVLAEVLCHGRVELLAATNRSLPQGVALASRLPTPWRLRLAGLLFGTYGSGEGIAAAVRRLRLANADQRWVTQTAAAANAVAESHDVTRPELRRWAARAQDPAAALQLAEAAAADSATAERVVAFGSGFRELAEVEDLTQTGPLLDGAAIMKLLKIETGPEIGRAIDFLREQRFELGPLTISEEAQHVEDWWHRSSHAG